MLQRGDLVSGACSVCWSLGVSEFLAGGARVIVGVTRLLESLLEPLAARFELRHEALICGDAAAVAVEDGVVFGAVGLLADRAGCLRAACCDVVEVCLVMRELGVCDSELLAQPCEFAFELPDRFSCLIERSSLLGLAERIDARSCRCDALGQIRASGEELRALLGKRVITFALAARVLCVIRVSGKTGCERLVLRDVTDEPIPDCEHVLGFPELAGFRYELLEPRELQSRRPLSDGAVKDGWATGLGEGRAMAKRLTGPLPEEGVELRSLEPGEAKSRIVAAAERGAQTGLTPTEEGLHALTVWLRASEHPDADAVVQALELGGVTLQELEDEAMARAVADLAAEAEAWSVEQGMEPEHAASIGFTAGLMGDFLASYLQLAPTDWRGAELEEFMLDWVPRKVTLGDEDAAGFPDHVAEVFGFLAETGRLEPATAVALGAWARGHRDTFAAAMADPALRGPARAVLDAMSADGVELGDEKAMQAWLEDFNMLPMEERDRILGPRVLPSQDLAGGARPGKTNAKRRKAQKQARKRNRR